MKTFCLITFLVAFLLLVTNRLQAQTTQTKLNQIELMKLQIGTFKCVNNKDTTVFWEGKPFGTGLECNSNNVVEGKTVREGRELWGYDKSIDKFIFAKLTKGKDIRLYAFGFISKNKYELILYSDIPNPEKASFKYEGEFKSLDMLVETRIVNNIPVKTWTYTRLKQ
jgi:hypothetical protein